MGMDEFQQNFISVNRWQADCTWTTPVLDHLTLVSPLNYPKYLLDKKSKTKRGYSTTWQKTDLGIESGWSWSRSQVLWLKSWEVDRLFIGRPPWLSVIRFCRCENSRGGREPPNRLSGMKQASVALNQEGIMCMVRVVIILEGRMLWTFSLTSYTPSHPRR